MDTYCGLGTIGLSLADACKSVMGVEINKEAIHYAKINARQNHIKNMQFVDMDATAFMMEAKRYHHPYDVIVLDPPRKGCDSATLQAVVHMAPSRIVMVSCNPATMARDSAILRENGYLLQCYRPIDLFPRTAHCETVCLLSKLSEVKNHISVKVDMNEMDLTAAESKATYQEIKEWVKEKYGFHVSHLNIAKTKRKCGIIERKNYNLPKNEDSRSPETPKEKEEAITEAFRHFQMI